MNHYVQRLALAGLPLHYLQLSKQLISRLCFDDQQSKEYKYLSLVRSHCCKGRKHRMYKSCNQSRCTDGKSDHWYRNFDLQGIMNTDCLAVNRPSRSLQIYNLRSLVGTVKKNIRDKGDKSQQYHTKCTQSKMATICQQKPLLQVRQSFIYQTDKSCKDSQLVCIWSQVYQVKVRLRQGCTFR